MKYFVGLTLVLTLLAAYITHLYWSVSSMFTNELEGAGQILLVILGVVCPPLGTLHGFYLWFT